MIYCPITDQSCEYNCVPGSACGNRHGGPRTPVVAQTCPVDARYCAACKQGECGAKSARDRATPLNESEMESKAPLEWRTCPVSQRTCTDKICQGQSLCRHHTADFITYRRVRALFCNMGRDGWSWSFTLGDVTFGGVARMPGGVRAFEACVDKKLLLLSDGR